MIQLTNRETDVLKHYASTGDSNKDIAKALKLSANTVGFYMGQIMKKTKSENRAQLIIKFNNKDIK